MFLVPSSEKSVTVHQHENSIWCCCNLVAFVFSCGWAVRPPVVKGNMVVILWRSATCAEMGVIPVYRAVFKYSGRDMFFVLALDSHTLDCNYEVKALIFSFEGVLFLINVELVALLWGMYKRMLQFLQFVGSECKHPQIKPQSEQCYLGVMFFSLSLTNCTVGGWGGSISFQIQLHLYCALTSVNN